MADGLAAGLAMVLAGGFFQGGFLAPSKWIRGWAWENYWLLFAISAYLICPWALALTTIPGLGQVYAATSAGALTTAFLFGIAWGIGAITFGLGVDALGLSLGFAVILGVSTVAGALIPLAVLPSPAFGAAKAALTAAALLLMLAGVGVCSAAGRWKEGGGARPYRRGLLICVASGFLSACGNLGFAFGGEVVDQARRLGVAEHLATSALWTLLTLPLFLANSGFAGWRLWRNGTARHYGEPRAGRHALLALSMGVMWMAGMGLYGAGARTMGPLGPSLGWALLMSSMVLVANLIGFLTGEWSGAPAGSRRQLFAGLGVLVLAIALMGFANAV